MPKEKKTDKKTTSTEKKKVKAPEKDIKPVVKPKAKSKPKVDEPKTKATKPNIKPPVKKDRIEKGELTFESIMNAFRANRGNVFRTCKALNIGYTTFHDYVKKYPELQKAKDQYFEEQKQDLGKTAIDVLIDVAMSDNVAGAMGNINLSSSRVKAAETLAKISGILVEKQEVEHSGNKDKPLVSVNYIVPKPLEQGKAELD